MKCLCVCQKISTFLSELSARGTKRDVCQALPAAGRLWPSDDYDEDDLEEEEEDDVDDDDDENEDEVG